MKQLILSYKTGTVSLEDVPVPVPSPNEVLIKTSCSLVSTGTERMLVDFGRSNPIRKLRSQPEKFKLVLDKAKTDGIFPTLLAISRKLDRPIPMGYCNVGEVVELGKNVREFQVGDRVVSNGSHSEYVSVAAGLVAKIPDEVSNTAAVFTVVGSIGLHSIRQAKPEMGECFVIFGLGLIGLLTAQMLKANGCIVIGIDPNSYKCAIAEQLGIPSLSGQQDDMLDEVHRLSAKKGADGAIITASSSNDPVISQAAQLCRQRGRIILVGFSDLNINRSEFYEKELQFQVSRSYGPGRYDFNYEAKGMDYPLPYVRWTVQRNFETVLREIEANRMQVEPLITHTVSFPNYSEIYSDLHNPKRIASILNYPQAGYQTPLSRKTRIDQIRVLPSNKSFALIGAGNFVTATMLPALKKSKAQIKYIVSEKGLNAKLLANKYKIPFVSSDLEIVLKDPDVSMALIAAPNHLHASMTEQFLVNGKSVFVEKPFVLSPEQLTRVQKIYGESDQSNLSIHVGYNRRFSPHILAIRDALGDNPGPLNMVFTVNAGPLADDHWVRDPDIGGGRIIGEVCHFIDALVALVQDDIIQVCGNVLGRQADVLNDSMSVLLRFKNGSNGVVNYFANGSKSYPKEKLEVFYGKKILVLHNFRTTKGYGFKQFRNLKTRQDKGHQNQFNALVRLVESGGKPLIPFREIKHVSQVCFAIVESLKKKTWVNVEF